MNSRTLMLLLILTVPSVIQAQEWYAVARHGECFDLAKLNERSDLVKGAKTPGEMEEMMNNASVAYTIEPVIQNQEGMLKLKVPSER